MILYRHNGETICLTPEEMREIHQEVEHLHRCEDVRARIEEAFAGPQPIWNIDQIVQKAERILDRNDVYYGAYWESIESAIREWRDQHVGNFQNDRPV